MICPYCSNEMDWIEYFEEDCEDDEEDCEDQGWWECPECEATINDIELTEENLHLFFGE